MTLPVRLPLLVLLIICLMNFAGLRMAAADGLHGVNEKKPFQSSIQFNVEEHKAEKKLVLKLGLPMNSPPQFMQNAGQYILDTFHQWGTTVEKVCHNLDQFFKTNANGLINMGSSISSRKPVNAAEEQCRPKLYSANDGRAKAI